MKTKLDEQPSHSDPVAECLAGADSPQNQTSCPYTRYAELYVKGLLFSWEQAAFELHLMECKICLKAVEIERQSKLDGASHVLTNEWRNDGANVTTPSKRQEDGTSCRSLH